MWVLVLLGIGRKNKKQHFLEDQLMPARWHRLFAEEPGCRLAACFEPHSGKVGIETPVSLF